MSCRYANYVTVAIRFISGCCQTQQSYGHITFLGSTGTGKTELAEAIAEVFFGDRSRAVRFDREI